MIEIPSAIENRQFKLIDLENELKPLGYVIGGGWEYDHGHFDYKIDDQNEYIFLRVPFKAIKGEIGEKGVVVELGRPFLLAHQYQSGLDDQVRDYNAFMNQFSEPLEKDAEVPDKYIATGEALVRELESTLMNN